MRYGWLRITPAGVRGWCMATLTACLWLCLAGAGRRHSASGESEIGKDFRLRGFVKWQLPARSMIVWAVAHSTGVDYPAWVARACMQGIAETPHAGTRCQHCFSLQCCNQHATAPLSIPCCIYAASMLHLCCIYAPYMLHLCCIYAASAVRRLLLP
jgi:hypothetical protein